MTRATHMTHVTNVTRMEGATCVAEPLTCARCSTCGGYDMQHACWGTHAFQMLQRADSDTRVISATHATFSVPVECDTRVVSITLATFDTRDGPDTHVVLATRAVSVERVMSPGACVESATHVALFMCVMFATCIVLSCVSCLSVLNGLDQFRPAQTGSDQFKERKRTILL